MRAFLLNLVFIILLGHLFRFVRCRIIFSWKFYCLGRIMILCGILCRCGVSCCRILGWNGFNLKGGSSILWIMIILCMGRGSDRIFYLFWIFIFDSLLTDLLSSTLCIGLSCGVMSIGLNILEFLDLILEEPRTNWI